VLLMLAKTALNQHGIRTASHQQYQRR